MTEYDIKNRKNKQEQDDDEGGGEGERDFQWQRRLYDVYELIHEQHEGEKAPTEGFKKDQVEGFGEDPLLNRDLHPLAHEAYFSGIDETAGVSVPSENTDPNIRNELRKQLTKRLEQTLDNTHRPTPKPF